MKTRYDFTEIYFIYECFDCGDMFPRLRRWKLEPMIQLCENCHEARYLELSGDDE